MARSQELAKRVTRILRIRSIHHLVVSACTEATAGEHTICTPGHFDTHIHMISRSSILMGSAMESAT